MVGIWSCSVILFFLCDRIPKLLLLSKQSGEFFLFHEPFIFTHLSSQTILILLILFFICVEFILFFQYTKKNSEYLYSPVFILLHALLAAGVLSNLYDRLLYGSVLDIFSVPHLVVFNLADIFILLGGFGILLYTLRNQ